MAKAAKKVAVAVNMGLLAAIVAATNSEAGFMFTSAADHGPLVEAGYVEVNSEITNDAGEVATRATQKGNDAVNTTDTNTDAASPAPVSTGFAIAGNVPLPGISGRGRGGETTYPFDKLDVNQSFFVANSADKPNAAKSLASTVSSATARFAVEKRDEAGNVVTKMAKVREYQKDEAGEFVKNAEGKRVLLREYEEERPEMVETRKFVVRSVDDGAPWGFPGVKGAGVWRVA